ncbi:hypothetical protein AQV86_05750 [Nanohaloarchaea archaeon SG9]|nr:hypothetical protein AQV86_05750 [Nanohaloarchaea archaeon SG9]
MRLVKTLKSSLEKNIKTVKNVTKSMKTIGRTFKGQNFSIKTMALIVLGIMVVVLVYGAFSGWFDNVVNNFTGNINYPQPRS